MMCVRSIPCPVHSKPKDPVEIEDRAWDLLEACREAYVADQGSVGSAMARLLEALYRV